MKPDSPARRLPVWSALCAGLLLYGAGVPAAEPGPAEAVRSVTVDGQGEVSAMPDRAQLWLAVQRIEPDLQAAEKQVDAVVRAYLATAQARGVAAAQIDTTGTSIQPEYVWDEPTRNNRLTGYRVRRDIHLQVRQLDRLAGLIQDATRAGVNEVRPPQLESSKSADLQRDALAAAALDARARAERLATTLGMRLGPVLRVDAGDAAPEPPMPRVMAMRADAAGSDGAELGLNAGEIRYTARVRAAFELTAP